MILIIYCEDCTRQARLKDKYAVVKFDSLTEAVNHITQYQHDIKIDLEDDNDE